MIRFLGHMYLAEALIKLDKIHEAIQELSTEHLKAYQTFDQEIEALNTGRLLIVFCFKEKVR